VRGREGEGEKRRLGDWEKRRRGDWVAGSQGMKFPSWEGPGVGFQKR